MIGTLLIAAAYLLPALVARKRKMGFARALLLSLLFTPLLALPVALRSRKRKDIPFSGSNVPEKSKTDNSKRTPPDVSITDAWVLSERNTKGVDRIHSDKIPLPRQKEKNNSKGMKV